MTDRPIIFSGPMVRALIDGRKTQTRRLATSPLRRVEAGDRLYVRESGIYFQGRPGGAGELFRHDVPNTPETGIYWSRNNGGPGASYNVDGCSRASALAGNAKVRPSIHMPRWASRLTLIVEGVRVEPLQAISEADAIAEGAARLAHDGEGHFFEHPTGTHICGYAGLWDHLHGAGSWDENPQVVALTFRVELGNIDRLERLAA